MTTALQRPAAGRERGQESVAAPAPPPVVGGSGLGRAGRRNGRRVAGGLLLVIATVVAFWQIDLRRHADESFLATARPVAAGQVITDADVTVVRVANTSGLALLPAAERGQVVGRSAAVPLAAGSLLMRSQLGPVAWPPAGQAVIAVPVKPGRAPAGLTAGTRVTVLVTASNAAPAAGDGATATARRATATIVSVADGGDQPGAQVVTLLLDAAAAEQIAAASGEVSLVQLGPGR